jgi:3-dehydroquinate dehydratase
MSMGMRAPLVYAALPDEGVAPGQLSIRAMVEFRGLVARR